MDYGNSFTGMLQKFILIEYMLVSLLWHLEIKARLFSNSPRIALFENAKIPDVRKDLSA